MVSLLWLIVVLLLAAWFVGVIANIGGAVINVLLVVVLVVLVLNLVSGSRGGRWY